METVGFIGLGNMGMGMGGNIQKADYPMVVFDIRDSAMQPFVQNGARSAGSPAEVASLSDVVFTSLPGPKEVEQVATGAERGIGGDQAWWHLCRPLDQSTNSDSSPRADVPSEGCPRPGCAGERR